MSDYKIVYECDQCRQLDLNCRTLACSRHLCLECSRTHECPCPACSTALPPFRPKIRSCPVCETPLTRDGPEFVCVSCRDNSIESASTLTLLYKLAGRLFLCGGTPPSPTPRRAKKLRFDIPTYTQTDDWEIYPEGVRPKAHAPAKLSTSYDASHAASYAASAVLDSAKETNKIIQDMKFKRTDLKDGSAQQLHPANVFYGGAGFAGKEMTRAE